MEILKSVKSGKWSFTPEEAWRSVPEESKDLVSKMICKADHRLSATEVIEHSWMQAAGDGVSPAPVPPQEPRGPGSPCEPSPRTKALKERGHAGAPNCAVDDGRSSQTSPPPPPGAGCVAGSPSNAVKAVRRAVAQEGNSTEKESGLSSSTRAVLNVIYKACDKAAAAAAPAAKAEKLVKQGQLICTPAVPQDGAVVGKASAQYRAAGTEQDAPRKETGVGTIMANLPEDCGGAVTCP